MHAMDAAHAMQQTQRTNTCDSVNVNVNAMQCTKRTLPTQRNKLDVTHLLNEFLVLIANFILLCRKSRMRRKKSMPANTQPTQLTQEKYPTNATDASCHMRSVYCIRIMRCISCVHCVAFDLQLLHCV